MGKTTIFPIAAIFILLFASGCSLYVFATETTSDTIIINDQPYTIDQLLQLGKTRQFEDLNFQGIALDDIIKLTGVIDPEAQEYNIIGMDGYQKTVHWENLKQGLLTKEKQVVFLDLPKAFRVKDVSVIEVIYNE